MLAGTKGEDGGHVHKPWHQASLDASTDVGAKDKNYFTYNCTQL